MPLAGGCQPSSPVKIRKLCVPTRLFLPTPTQYPRPTPHEKSEIWPRRIRDLSTKIQYMGTHPEGHRPTVRRTLVTLSTLRSVGECLRRQAAVHVSLDLRIICSSSRLSRKSILPSNSTN